MTFPRGTVWDERDVPRLAAHLAPPLTAQEAESTLYQIWETLGTARWHDRQQKGQDKQMTERELVRVRKALTGLNTRALWALERELGGAPPISPIVGMLALERVRTAVDQAIENLPSRRAGHPGICGDVERKFLRVLHDLYCRTHEAPPSWYDFFQEEVRNPEAVVFAIDCLQAWLGPVVDELTPENAVRSLQ
jgi:hypothetical protein